MIHGASLKITNGQSAAKRREKKMLSKEEVIKELFLNFPEEKEQIEILDFQGKSKESIFKCKKCNKRNSVFKRLDTGENICLLCGVKIEYESQGIKGIYKVLKFQIFL